MARKVRVKIDGVDGVREMNEETALRFIKANPTWHLVEPPTVESITLPPLPQKKSAEVAAESNKEAPRSIGHEIPSNEKKAEPVTTTKTTQQVLKQPS